MTYSIIYTPHSVCEKLHYFGRREYWTLYINGTGYHGFISKEQAEQAAQQLNSFYALLGRWTFLLIGINIGLFLGIGIGVWVMYRLFK